MSMRLQPKSEVLEKQASEQKQRIEEGLRLAKRVDRLRETQAQEDASLEKFRREKVAAINAEIAETRGILTPLQVEVANLKAERERLMKPLTLEWEAVALARQEAETLTASADSRVKEAEKAESKARTTLNYAETLMKAVDQARFDAASSLSDAENHRIEAQRKHDLAAQVLDETNRMQEDVKNELIPRIAAVSMREEGVRMKEAVLNDREADISKEWVLLEDRKRMLERDIIRAKKKP